MDSGETVLYYSIVIVIMTLLVFLAIFFRGGIKVQKELLREHTGRIKAEVESVERERERIAADLHDETGGMLYDLLRKSEQIEPKDGRSRELLADLRKAIGQVDESVRGIAENTISNELQLHGIGYALQELVRRRQGANGINILLEQEEIPILTNERWLHVYRLSNECINNAIKHSGAKKIEINIRHNAGNIILSVKDDGKGFDAGSANLKKSGHGLNTIYSRVRLLGGEAYLNSLGGCEWIFWIPVKQHKTEQTYDDQCRTI
jgi:two-component system, NarL family, sensor kinase